MPLFPISRFPNSAARHGNIVALGLLSVIEVRGDCGAGGKMLGWMGLFLSKSVLDRDHERERYIHRMDRRTSGYREMGLGESEELRTIHWPWVHLHTYTQECQWIQFTFEKKAYSCGCLLVFLCVAMVSLFTANCRIGMF